MSQFINLAGELRYVSEFCRKGGPLQPDRTASFGRGTASVLMNGEGSPLFDGVGRAGVDNLAQKTGPEQCGCLRVLTPVVSEHLRRGNDHIHEAGYFAAAPSYFGRGVCSGALHLPGGGARFAEVSAGGCLNALPSSASAVTMWSRNSFVSCSSTVVVPGARRAGSLRVFRRPSRLSASIRLESVSQTPLARKISTAQGVVI